MLVELINGSQPYIIAEIGNNHQGSLKVCKEMFDAAKWAGCDAVKLQKRDNKSLYSEDFYNTPYNSEHAFGKTYGEHREALEFGAEQYHELQNYADRLGLAFFATAFDIPSAHFLEALDMPAYKIASGSIRDFQLVAQIKEFDKPIIVSTGGISEDELLDVMRKHDLPRDKLVLMQCVSAYPCPYELLNLRIIGTYTKLFPGVSIGWSGHDTGIAMAPVAYSLGARMIEKHFTLNRAWKGTDQAFSLEPKAMQHMIENLKAVSVALGSGIKQALEAEIEPLKKQLKNADGRIDGKTALR